MLGNTLKAALLLTTLAVGAQAIIIVVGKRGVGEGEVQHLMPSNCILEIDVEKRDSPEVDFQVCARDGDICTSRDVPTCPNKDNSCNSFDSPFDVEFPKLYPDAYAYVCKLSSGEQCLYTDIIYETCGSVEAQDEKLCLPLTNGELECADIPEEQIQMLQNYGGRLTVSGNSAAKPYNNHQHRPYQK